MVNKHFILFFIVLIALSLNHVAVANIDSWYITLTKARFDSQGRALEFWDTKKNVLLGVNQINVPLNGTMVGTFWARWASTGDAFEQITLQLEPTADGWMHATVAGMFNEDAYLAPVPGNSSQIWGGIARSSTLPSGFLYYPSLLFDSFFYLCLVNATVPLNMLFGPSGSSSTGIGTGIVPTVDLNTQPMPLSDTINEQGKVEVTAGKIETIGQNTFSSMWRTDIRTLAISGLGGTSSPSMLVGSVDYSVSAEFYKNSSLKLIIDKAMIGFTAFVAFLMPYNELKKGK